MEIISNVALISINETLVVQVVGFLIFLFVINRIMFRPLQNVMTDRELYIERITRDIAKGRKEVEALANRIQEQESAIKKEAFALKEELEARGSQAAKELFAAAKQQIADNNEKIKLDMDAKITSERRSLQKEADSLAQDIMAKILDRRPDL